MKLRKVDAGIDRRIITGMVVSDIFLKSFLPIYNPRFFKSSYAITVAEWCRTYFEQYGQAPGKTIQDIFYSKQREGLDGTDLESIEHFLMSLSDEYEQQDKFNHQYLLDEAEKTIGLRQYEELKEDLSDCLMQGNLQEIEYLMNSFKKSEIPKTAFVDITDPNIISQAFDSVEQPLFKLPGAYGELLNPHFVREGFVALLGREKIGKTFRMMDLSNYALKDKCKVAFFQLGDLSSPQFVLRQCVLMAKKSNVRKYCERIRVPVLDCYKNQVGECKAKKVVLDKYTLKQIPELSEENIYEHVPCTKCKDKDDRFKGAIWWDYMESREPLNKREAVQVVQKWERRFKISKRFRLKTYPNDSANVGDIEKELDIWKEKDGFVPDVLFLDYPDIMRPEDTGQRDFRHQENERWKALRRLSQELKCLVIVVTQSTKAGHSGNNLTAMDVSEEKRKLSHVTAMFALNQTDLEKGMGLIRIAPLVLREGEFSTGQQVCILQSIQTGRPHIASYWKYSPERQANAEGGKNG